MLSPEACLCCLEEGQSAQQSLCLGARRNYRASTTAGLLLLPCSACQGRHSKRSCVSFYGPLKDLAEHQHSNPRIRSLKLSSKPIGISSSSSWTRWVTFCICECRFGCGDSRYSPFCSESLQQDHGGHHCPSSQKSNVRRRQDP